MSITPEQLMRLAIAKTRKGMADGQSPFGCAIALNGVVISEAHNTVVKSPDATAHAEVNAIRLACGAVGSHLLEGAIVATTCEPCPMCMAALHWARVETVYYGATIADADRAGFSELNLAAHTVATAGGNRVRLEPGLLTKECQKLFEEWLARPDRQLY